MVVVPIERACHNDHACRVKSEYKCSIVNTSEDMSQVKVFVTEGQTDEWVKIFPAFAKGGEQWIKNIWMIHTAFPYENRCDRWEILVGNEKSGKKILLNLCTIEINANWWNYEWRETAQISFYNNFILLFRCTHRVYRTCLQSKSLPFSIPLT